MPGSRDAAYASEGAREVTVSMVAKAPFERHPMRGYLLALVAATCWATGGLTAKWLFTAPSSATASWPLPPLGIHVEPTALAGARALTSALLLALYLVPRRREELRVTKRELLFLAVFGVMGLAGVHYTYFMTISLTGVATAILLEYLAPILVFAVSVLFLGHRFEWSLPVGVVLSVAGCAMVVGAFSPGGLSISPQGLAWGLASAVLFALYSLMGGAVAQKHAPITTLFYGLGFAAIFWLLALGPGPILALLMTPRTALAVVFIAVMSTIIPFGCFLAALRHIPPTNATITSTLEPALAGIGAYLLFGEALSGVQLLGGLLVVAAIITVQSPWTRTPPPT